MTDLTTIRAGFVFAAQTLTLDRATIDAYTSAVGDPSPDYRGAEAVVPPLAILALSLRGLTDLLTRYPGATHAAQRLTALGPVPIGATVTAGLSVRARSERRGFAALILDIRVERDAAPVLEGETLLMVPLGRAEAAND